MYSPNVKPERKMKLEDFVKNLRGEQEYERSPELLCSRRVVEEIGLDGEEIMWNLHH